MPTLAIRFLRERGAKVVTAREVGHRRHPDENHAAYALKCGYVLLTCDRDYLDEHRFPLIHCPAIVARILDGIRQNLGWQNIKVEIPRLLR